MLAASQVREFYDRFGARQDQQGFYEDVALDDLVAPPVADGSVDRVVSTYVLDLLPDADIRTWFGEARRVLRPGGRLCLVSLAHGASAVTRLVSGAWSGVFRLDPRLVGGCRPIVLRPFCDGAHWEILHHRSVASWGITSEVLVAQRRA